MAKNLAFDFLIETIIFSIVALLIAFLSKNEILLTGMLLLFWIVLLFLWHEKEDFIMFIAGAVVGLLLESLISYIGIWNYSPNGVIKLIPLWLPLAWGFIGVLAKRFLNVISKL